MEWDDLDNRLCGILIDFSLEKGKLLFLEEKVSDIRIGDYISLYLGEKNEVNNSIYILGRITDLYWKSKKFIENSYGIILDNMEQGIKRKSISIEYPQTASQRQEKTITRRIHFGRNPYAIGTVEFLGVPEIFPVTWMKIFMANEKEIETIFGEKNVKSGFHIKINSNKFLPIDLKKEQINNNILIIGSFEEFLITALKELVTLEKDMIKIIFSKKTDIKIPHFSKIPLNEFKKLVSNEFGFENCSDEKILNAATSLNPPQIRLLSNLLNQAKKEKRRNSKLENLKSVITKNMEMYNGRYSQDLEKISNFLKMKWDDNNNLNTLIHNQNTIIDVSQEAESKEIVFSKFLRAIMNEQDNRKRNKCSPLECLLFIDDIEDYVPFKRKKELTSDQSITKEIFKSFVSHPDTSKIGLVMISRFPSRIDPLIFYLSPNRIFGEVFEERELSLIQEVFGVKEIELKKLRNYYTGESELALLLNLPSKFSISVVDGKLIKGR